jgi:hypothetical protein
MRVLAVVLSVAVFAGACTRGPAGNDVPRQRSLTRAELGVVRRVVAGAADGRSSRPGSVPDRLKSPGGPAFVSFRERGAEVGAAWAEGHSTIDALEAAAAQAAEQAKGRAGTAEVCLSHDYTPVERADTRLLGNVHLGILGLELRGERFVDRYSPTYLIANNLSLYDASKLSTERHDITAADSVLVRTRVFACDQVFVDLDGSSRATQMERGNTYVPLSAVTKRNVERLGARMGDWLVGAVRRSGRMTYTYLPSSDTEPPGNNMVRQWMSTVALGRVAAGRGDDESIYDLAARNIRYNLAHYYRTERGLGLIVERDGDVKLGAVALAALAIIEHPQRRSWAAEEKALLRTVDALWRKNGSFRTFYKPAGRNDNQNYYPGEALTMWSVLYERSKDPKLLRRIMTSLRYYKSWHLTSTNRMPAFIPWHTHANYRIWRMTRNPALRDFIFEMNDWLLAMQQDVVVYRDLEGRFYDPEHPGYGPPHIGSTGVYLESLIDAFALARRTGDAGRAERYRLAIRRGLRNVMQHEFSDAVDMYYVTNPKRTLGGLRENPYDSDLRVDSVQHSLDAVREIAARFTRRDYEP